MNVDPKPKVVKVSAKVTETTSGSGPCSGVAGEIPVEIQEPLAPENPPELEVQNVSEDCLVLKDQIRQLQNKVKTLKGHLTKWRLEKRKQRRKGKNQT